MSSLSSVFLSNRIEVLYQQFKTALFSASHPLTRRIVIVPGPALKSWLMFQMAQDPDLGISAGVEIGFIDPSINALLAIFFPEKFHKNHEGCEPPELAISFALEQEIMKIMASYVNLPADEQSLWYPLLAYLNVLTKGKIVMTRKSSMRILAFAATLSRLFLDYGRFGRRLIDSWVQEKHSGWQQKLWEKMEKFFSPWMYPCRKLESLQFQQIPDPNDVQVHVFGLSYVAPVHHRFLMEIGKKIPLNYYLISPCQKFWSDMHSDKEGYRLKAYWQKRQTSLPQQLALEEYLRDNNPLLANFGRLGREMALQIEECHLKIFEQYALPASIQEEASYQDLLDGDLLYYKSRTALSLLEAVQSDVALLRNPENSCAVSFDTYDHTIQIHAVPKPLREVQVVYDAIMSIFERHQSDDLPITPGDVIVMTPNIREYAPFIKSVFGGPGSMIDYQIMDIQVPDQNHFIQGFLDLIKLPFGRWDAVSLLRIFDYWAFQRRHQLTFEDVQLFRKWVKLAGICWGSDHEHRNELLKRDHCSRDMVEDSWNGTWEYGLGTLLESLAVGSEHAQNLKGGLSDPIDSTQGQLLGKIIQLLRSLLEDLKPLNDGSTLTLMDWSIYLKCLCEAYFFAGTHEDDLEGYEMLIEEIDALNQASRGMEEAVFSFDTIHWHLKHALQNQTIHHRESHLHAVRFCSLLPMRAVPAAVLILMGMQDGAFPGSDHHLSFNLLLKNPDADYYPTQIDFGRYLFLEMLLSARKYFLMSYLSHAPGSSKEQPPSLLVAELLAYLDKAYKLPEGLISHYCVFKHSLLSFDKCYFSPATSFKSYSSNSYGVALSYYDSDKKFRHNFLPAFSACPDYSDNGDDVLEIADLSAFARNPLRVYFNKVLGMYLEREEDRIVKCDEELQMAPLDIALLSREGLFMPVDSLLKKAELAGRLPRGPFKKMGVEKVMRECDAMRAHLLLNNVTCTQFFSIEFSDRFLAPILSGEVWQLPPLVLETPFSRKIKIIGRIHGISPQGLVTFGSDDIKEVIKIWPVLLVYCCLIREYHLPFSDNLIFVNSKKSKMKKIPFSNPKLLLIEYIIYYFKTKACASPLIPESIAPMLSRAVDELQHVYRTHDEDRFQPVYDAYLKWLSSNSPDIDLSFALEHWQTTVERLFGFINEAWYSDESF